MQDAAARAEAEFQSTHPLWGATRPWTRRCRAHRHFNPRTPCGVRLLLGLDGRSRHRFQSTRPMRGATSGSSAYCVQSCAFQSTRPMRGATEYIAELRKLPPFQSTHPLRGATERIAALEKDNAISIHAPLAGCDHSIRLPRLRQAISIYAPLAGCDCARHPLWEPKHYFNPRTPCGVRPQQILHVSANLLFQSTHPLRGATYGF